MTDPKFPFENFTKMMSAFKIPGVDMDAMMDAQRKNIEAVAAANRAAAEGAQALAGRQAEILRETMQQWQDAANDLIANADSESVASRQAEFVQTTMEQTLANMREMAEMAAKSQSDAFDTINNRLLESIKEMKARMPSK